MRDPDLLGLWGKAWDMNVDDEPGCVSWWVVEAPNYAAFWDYYSIFILCLRDVPEISKPPIIHLPNATHEIVVLCVNPESDIPAAINTGKNLATMTPTNFASQFICDSDMVAAKRASNSVRQIITGQLDPNADWKLPWVHVYGDNMLVG